MTLMYVKYGRGKRLARSRLGVGLPVPGRGWLGLRLRLGLGPVEAGGRTINARYWMPYVCRRRRRRVELEQQMKERKKIVSCQVVVR